MKKCYFSRGALHMSMECPNCLIILPVGWLKWNYCNTLHNLNNHSFFSLLKLMHHDEIHQPVVSTGILWSVKWAFNTIWNAEMVYSNVYNFVNTEELPRVHTLISYRGLTPRQHQGHRQASETHTKGGELSTLEAPSRHFLILVLNSHTQSRFAPPGKWHDA